MLCTEISTSGFVDIRRGNFAPLPCIFATVRWGFYGSYIRSYNILAVKATFSLDHRGVIISDIQLFFDIPSFAMVYQF